MRKQRFSGILKSFGQYCLLDLLLFDRINNYAVTFKANTKHLVSPFFKKATQFGPIMKLSVTGLKAVVMIASLAVLTSCVSKKKYEEAMTRAAAEKSALESALSEARAQNDQLQADFEELEGNLSMSKEEIQTLSAKIAANNKKIEMLKDAIAEAFETYDEEDVKVELRDGKLYMTMANSILFDAGEDHLSDTSQKQSDR